MSLAELHLVRDESGVLIQDSDASLAKAFLARGLVQTEDHEQGEGLTAITQVALLLLSGGGGGLGGRRWPRERGAVRVCIRFGVTI